MNHAHALPVSLLRELFSIPQLTVQRVTPAQREELEYQSLEGLDGKELRVYAAVTKQLWIARAVHLEDGTPLIDPARLRRY